MGGYGNTFLIRCGISTKFQPHQGIVGAEGKIAVDVLSKMEQSLVIELCYDMANFYICAALCQIVDTELRLIETSFVPDKFIVDLIYFGMERNAKQSICRCSMGCITSKCHI